MADLKPYSDEELNSLIIHVDNVDNSDRIVSPEFFKLAVTRFLATIAARDTTIQQQAATIERMRGEVKDCIAIMEQFDPDMDAPRLLEYNADLSGQIDIARQVFARKEK